MRVLLVEDDRPLCLGIGGALQALGWRVDMVHDGVTALGVGKSEGYDVAVLDLGLPRRDGMDVLASWRSAGVPWPVLILTARDTLHDRVLGLDAGADDYLIKPFDTPELIARLRALARRHQGQLHESIEVGQLTLSTASREVFHGATRLSLSPREFGLLELLMSRAGRLVPKDHIVTRMSSWEADFSENSVEVYISRLRRRLADTGVAITTVRGFGYVLDTLADVPMRPDTGDGAGHVGGRDE